MRILNLCLVLKLESGFYSERTDRRTNPPSTVLVYRYSLVLRRGSLITCAVLVHQESEVLIGEHVSLLIHTSCEVTGNSNHSPVWLLFPEMVTTVGIKHQSGEQLFQRLVPLDVIWGQLQLIRNLCINQIK